MTRLPQPPSSPDPDPPPVLCRLLYGEGAGEAWRSAPPEGPLREWGGWFDEWLERRHNQQNPRYRRQAITSWRYFLSNTHLPPWEVEAAHLRQWIQDLFEGGRKPSTIRRYMTEIRSFYRSVAAQHPNPTLGLAMPKLQHYHQARWLCAQEVEALLGAINREDLLGKRDFALFLMLLLSGQHVSRVQNLRWGDLEFSEAPGKLQQPPGWPRVSWRRGGEMRSEPLPAECWQALHDYLAASGRLEEIGKGDHLFAPLNQYWGTQVGLACDWNASHPLPITRFYEMLQRYLGWAELEVDKFSLHDLRHSAVMLRVEAGAGPEEIQAWLGMGRLKSAKQYLTQLKKQTVSEARLAAAERVWHKGPYRRQVDSTGELINIKHGYYAQNSPYGKESPSTDPLVSMDELIGRMQAVLNRTFELVLQESDPHECVRLMDIYGRAADRLLRAVERARQLKEQEAVRTLHKVLEELGRELESEQDEEQDEEYF